METIMILGAGAAQLPLYRAAKALGLRTVAVTIPGPYPGIDEADEVSYTDITDPEAVARAAKELRPAGVVSCCSEIALPALARACEACGLPGITPEAAAISVNKRVMHGAFDRGGVTAPRWRVLETEADLDAAISALGFPLVVKAPDLFSSRGVYVVRSADEAREALRESLAETNERYVLAEEFIAGRSFCLEAFVQNGEIFFRLPDGNLTIQNPGRPAIPIGHYAPLDEPEETLAVIRAAAEKAIRACGLDHCAVNMDLVLRDGTPYLIELTARAGATALSEMLSAYFGVNYYEMLLYAALGRDAHALFDRRLDPPRPAAVAMLTSQASGVVRSLSVPETLPEGVRELTLLVAPGDTVRRFSNAGDRIGQTVVTGTDTADCLRRIDEVLAQVRVEVDP